MISIILQHLTERYNERASKSMECLKHTTYRKQLIVEVHNHVFLVLIFPFSWFQVGNFEILIDIITLLRNCLNQNLFKEIFLLFTNVVYVSSIRVHKECCRVPPCIFAGLDRPLLTILVVTRRSNNPIKWMNKLYQQWKSIYSLSIKIQ